MVSSLSYDGARSELRGIRWGSTLCGVWWVSGDEARILTPSEQRFVRHATYTGRSVRVEGELDTAALDAAFVALVRTFPVLACRIGEDAEGRGHLLRPSGAELPISVASGDPEEIRLPSEPIDPRQRLAYLDVTRADAGSARVTIFVHHSVADAGQCVELLSRLWSYYTEYLASGWISVAPQYYPRPLEAYVAEANIVRGPLSGLEQVHRPLEPAERIVPPDPREPAPAALHRPLRTTVDTETTARLVAHGKRTGIGVNGLVTAALLRAYAGETGEPRSLGCVYPVDLRTRLHPPVAPTAGTNMAGLASFSAHIDTETDLFDLGAMISEHLRRDIASGLVAQSVLHFPDYYGPDRRYSLAGHIAVTNTGRVPTFTAPGLRFTDYEIVYVSAHPRPSTGPSAAVTFLLYTFADRLAVGVLGGGDAAERLPEAVAKQLDALAAETPRDHSTAQGD
ncbi:phthiocerol/phthiodiolone dimycocerosyl transferase family protein [Nocardia bovistercoris]|uniref:Phthiocerol/phthiodiolone dimycocerosyl transferase n=1 Tax=Nocardia bovistercoris TaxID=2785916 RepID=A0A931N3K1_9NOCA|nr:acyltransferase [Nocardia bovistercoris]MBH0777261.1 acyltransferase [Nocardia bovistercoris]